jgi:hypothetical protein
MTWELLDENHWQWIAIFVTAASSVITLTLSVHNARLAAKVHMLEGKLSAIGDMIDRLFKRD